MTKYIYENENYEIAVEDVKNGGVFLEVELKKQVEDGEEEIEKNKIRNFIKSFGFNFEEMNMGKPEYILNKKI